MNFESVVNFSVFIRDLSLFTLVIGFAILIGGILPALRHYKRERFPIFLSFSAGLMLGSSFLHLIPGSIHLVGETASFAVLAGFVFLFVVEKFVTVHICESLSLDCEVHKIGIAAFIGLALHSLIDGFALGSGLLSVSLGLVVFIAVFAHKTPEAFSLTSILLHSQFSRIKVVASNILLWAMVPIGALLAFFVVGGINESYYLGLALGFAAGTFLEICLTDLIPEIHRLSSSRWQTFLSFMGGIGIMWVVHKISIH
ncbi:MAG: ZIP family metal transporter [Deltaproteobacteria bacterium]|nr:ZIP family metal transporter [Deltaproteobacteria bacterium]